MRDKPQLPGMQPRSGGRGSRGRRTTERITRKKVETQDLARRIGYNKFPLSRVCQLIGRLYHLIKATRLAHLLSVSRQLGPARVLNCRMPAENQEKSLSPEFTHAAIPNEIQKKREIRENYFDFDRVDLYRFSPLVNSRIREIFSGYISM